MTSKRGAKAGLLLLVALPMVVVAAAWLFHRWEKLRVGEPAYVAGAVGNLCALVGLPLLVVMVALGTRLPGVERLWGLDRMLRFHKLLAKGVVALFLAHAALRTLKFSMVSGKGWDWSFLITADLTARHLAMGRFALYGLVALSGLAVVGSWLLPFRAWKAPHLLLYPVVALGFAHAQLIGDDIAKPPYNIVWYALAAALAGVVAYRVVYRIRRDTRSTWLLEKIERETHDTTSILLERAEGSRAYDARQPGQFSLLRIRDELGWGDPHPFTISCMPTAEQLRYTIKRVGRFTAAVPSLPQYTPVLCEGPYGVFCPNLKGERNIVMIAGGVGVTPFLSAIRHAHRAAPNTRITLVWNNKTRSDIIAAAELAELTRHLWLRVVHVLSREDERADLPPDDPPEHSDWTGVFYARGHITANLLKKHVEPEGASYYLCGPKKMQRFVLRQLRQAFGVKARQVKRERFSW